MRQYTYVARVGEVRDYAKLGAGDALVQLQDEDIRLRTTDSVLATAMTGFEIDPPVPAVNDPGMPDPDPLRWADPVLDGVDGLPSPTENPTQLWMAAAPCVDEHPPVQYRFIRYADAVTGVSSFESTWQPGNQYTDTGLTPGVGYYYVFRARDALGNMAESPRVPGKPVLTDLNPPMPDPTEWDPYGLPVRVLDPIGSGYVDYMVALQAMDPEGTTVEYRFVCEDSPALSSPWRSQPWQDHNGNPREPWEYIVSVLQFSVHDWHVMYRDTSPNQNQAQPSVTVRTESPF